MPRTVHRLGSRYRALRPGIHADGGNLYLQVTKGKKGNVRRSWLFKFEINGKRHEMGLGSADTLLLAEARERARQCRLQILDGIDPIQKRKSERATNIAANAKKLTFQEASEIYVRSHRAEWKNAKHAAQWASTLRTHVFPVIGRLDVSEIETPHILKVLEPIWNEIPETASRVRGRIESVLAWATVSAYRTGDNPARWRGHLQEALAAKTKIQPVTHHSALPYGELPQFMSELRQRESVSARALEFCILSTTRTGETLKAQWGEIDLETKTWTIPAERMKAKREHRVPLTSRMVEILKALPKEKDNPYVFIGTKLGQPLSHKVMLGVLRGMHASATTHGFRSSFRDWAGETTNYPREVAEMALAHAVGSKVEAAYRRGDLFEKRSRLMAEWSRYCASTPAAKGGVVPIRA